MATANVTVLRPGERTVDEWAAYVAEAWERTAASLVLTGARLLECRDACDDAEYLLVLARIRMRPRTAHKLARIAECDRIDVRAANTLPSSVEVLLELTKMSEEQWELAEATGLVNTDLTKEEVRKFKREARKRAEEEVAVRATAARADPDIEVDPKAQAAFMREATLLGTVDRLQRWPADTDPAAVWREAEGDPGFTHEIARVDQLA